MMTGKTANRIVLLSGLWFFLCFLRLSFPAEASFRNDPEKKTLPNGLTLISQKDASSAVTVLQFLIIGGKRAEPGGKDGLAYLTTRLAVEIPDFSKAQNLMQQASRVSMMSRDDYSLINVVSLSENLKETLKVTTEIMLKPLFSGIRIDRVTKQMTHQKKTQEDDPIKVGHIAYQEKFFRGTAYGGSYLGSEKTLKEIKRKDIQAFYDTCFRAGNMIVAVVSDLDKEELEEILNPYLSRIPSGEAPSFEPITAVIPEEKSLIIEKDTQQFFVSVCFPLPRMTVRNYCLASLLETLIGKGINSRLWRLRVKENLAYNVNCVASQMKEAGFLMAYLETGKEKKEIALESLKQTLHTLYEEGIDEEELSVTKTYSRASFLMDNETKTARASYLAAFEASGLGYDFLNRFGQEIEAISLKEMNAFIKTVLNPEKGTVVIVGPAESGVPPL